MFTSFKPLVGLLLALVASLASADTIGVGRQGNPPFSGRELKDVDQPGASTGSMKTMPFEVPTAAPEPGADRADARWHRDDRPRCRAAASLEPGIPVRRRATKPPVGGIFVRAQ